ncbi:MAG: bifunctional oligoribonuclease/PAP phosphatase NrnA [Candidatus Micrarchaeia archaeon]
MNKLNALESALNALKGKTLVTFQEVGDLDAVASALVLAEVVPNSSVRSTGQVNSQAKRVLKHFGLSVPPIESLDFDNIAIVDAGNSGVLGKWARPIEEFKGKLVVVDHHFHSHALNAFYYYADKGKSSTCEIIFDLLKLGKKKVGKRQALLLAGGIISDTAFFKSANDASFVALGELLDIIGKGNKDYEKVVSLVKSVPDISERLSRINAIKNAKIQQNGKILVATAYSTGFELSCASALVEAGFSAAFVGNKKHARVFGVRSDDSKSNIGKIMQKAGKILGGSGGGHEKVGGANGSAKNVEKAVEECAKLVLNSN